MSVCISPRECLFTHLPLVLAFRFLVAAHSFQYHNHQRSFSQTQRVYARPSNETFYFDQPIVESLDLVPLLERVASRTGTHRGRQALLALVTEVTPTMSTRATSKRDLWLQQSLSVATKRQKCVARIASAPHEAQLEYDCVQQATRVLSESQYPPMYGADTGPLDAEQQQNQNDHDAWLEYSAPDEFSLQDILEAEQVVNMILNVYSWSIQDDIHQWLSLLLPLELNVESLRQCHSILRGTVEIRRVRTVRDPHARSSFAFQLCSHAFPDLHKLHKLRDSALANSKGKSTKLPNQLENDIAAKEQEILNSLAMTILNYADAIDQALHSIGQLDVIFAKAAFGLVTNGMIPKVGSGGIIHVDQFVHPLLLDTTAVPIDLKFNDTKSLILSGANGGGKTLSLKSFGVVAILAKLGIPIPTAGTVRPHVDLFDVLFVSIGDHQDVSRGQSTFTAQLETYSTFLQTIVGNRDTSYLVLLDELGAGTDASAGGAIGQAILEEFLLAPSCRVVATTHSQRLKTLSFDSDQFECASVVVSSGDGVKYSRRPTFQLTYGIIGESLALNAASRCTTPLPPTVLRRASELLGDSSSSSQYTHALSKSLAKQVELQTNATAMAESLANDSARCQRALLSLTASYEREFVLLQDRVEQCYQTLRNSSSSEPLELLGETLREIRVAKKQIQSRQALLRERGLKLMYAGYKLKENESVVIVDDDGVLDGTTATVVKCEGLDNVHVLPSFDPLSLFDYSDEKQSMIVKRSQLAIWDYDSILQEDDDDRVTSVTDSKRRLGQVLASLKSSKNGIVESTNRGKASTSSCSFTSSRARKASKQTTSGKKRKK
jgi:hypothetical protein